ncbi:MAG: hypothetical protein JJU02_15445 [Cryomorphaceae bacterium]|nr:hypothetical protein [Cryomorphaceae bacterium]
MKLSVFFLGSKPLIVLFLILLSSVACKQDDDKNGSDDPYSVKNRVGSSANDILSEDKFTKLVLEIAYMPGMQLRSGTINATKSFLESRIYKSDGIEVITREVPSGGKSAYSPDDLRTYEDEHRTVFPEENTLTIWICIVDGEYSSPNVLGVAYQNLSCALMGETIVNNSGGLSRPSREKVETVVTLHELGHLLGLVDIGTPMVENHKGKEGHCNNSNCLMYYAVETTEFLSLLFNQPIPELDGNCLVDLENNGGR